MSEIRTVATACAVAVALVTAWLAFDPLASAPEQPPLAQDCDLSTRDLLALPGCATIASDTGLAKAPEAFWGEVDCQSRSRHRRILSGGDPAPRADGRPQGDDAFRRLRVLDGDRVSGERCELGLNDGAGPTALYREGQRRITFASLRIPREWNTGDPNWRVALQMKQAQPYNNPELASMLELQVREGRWLLISDWSDLWTTAATSGRWARFAFDVTYSGDPELGRINVYADLNGDGDSTDPGERSPTIEHVTLRRESPGEQDRVAAGSSIPSHLRAGLYQNPVFSCPPPRGCWMDVDNVQVLDPAPRD